MKKSLLFWGIFVSIFFGMCLSAYSQPAGYKQVNPYHKHYADSLENMDYKPVFPLFAKKAYKKGFDIPLPYGISPTFFYMKQEMTFADTKIGFNDLEMQDFTDAINFGKIVNTTNVLTIRPDLWLFPFLNIYGVAGYGTSQVVVPIDAVGNNPINFSTTQKFGVSSLGFGVTVAGGIGPVFFTLDNNMNWAKVETLEKAVPAYNLDGRIGHAFISARHPQRSITIWIGAFYQNIKASTLGEIKLSEVVDQEEVDELKERIEASDLSRIEKKFLEDGLDSLSSTTVHYSLSKRVAGPWNMIFGAQYQFNKHWQCRLELGTLGKRSQLMLNLNYRFQSFKCNKNHSK